MRKPKYLTKSRFKLGRECPVKLYYTGKKEYPITNDDNDFLAALADGGFQVGELAKYMYPGGHDIKELDYAKSLQQTNELLKQENVIIYEAAVQYQDYFIRVDVLKKTGTKIELIEVKAKSFDSDNDSFINTKGNIESGVRPYLEDVTFQTWVTRNAFTDFEIAPFLMLADKAKRATVNGLNQKFRITTDNNGRKGVSLVGGVSPADLGEPILTAFDVEPYVELILAEENFINSIAYLAEYYKKDELKVTGVAAKCKHCEYNYPVDKLNDGQKSGFRECWSRHLGWTEDDFAKPHVFQIWYGQSAKMMEKGQYLMEDLDLFEEFSEAYPEHKKFDQSKFTRKQCQLLQVEAALSGDDTEQVHQMLFSEMDSWNFPLHFIDFETTSVAIPFYAGQRPYEQVAFQFSCHSYYEDGRIEHSEWINREPGKFPNFEFVKALKDVLDKDNGTVFRFATHENTILNHIKEQLKEHIISGLYSEIENLEELRDWISTITKNDNTIGQRNMVDMCDIAKKYYFNPLANGSYSIKKLLPAVLAKSESVQHKYAKPYNGTNFSDWIWLKFDDRGKPIDPYKQLPPLEQEFEFFSGSTLNVGGDAMKAYNALQYVEMNETERETITSALLKYCELDTLAMVMIYEHWQTLKQKR